MIYNSILIIFIDKLNQFLFKNLFLFKNMNYDEILENIEYIKGDIKELVNNTPPYKQIHILWGV